MSTDELLTLGTGRDPRLAVAKMAPDEGIEPPLTVLETAVIPLDQSGKNSFPLFVEDSTTWLLWRSYLNEVVWADPGILLLRDTTFELMLSVV